jgi:hypothetical protein
MTFEIPEARALALEARVISRARRSERRNCASYSRCFYKAAYSNRVAVPCEKCKKFKPTWREQC